MPSSSEHEGTVDDQHGVHDLRVIILTHIDGTSHKALGLGIEHAHRKSLHVKTGCCGVNDLSFSFRASRQPNVEEPLVFSLVIELHSFQRNAMEHVIDVDLRGAVVVKRTPVTVCPVVAMQIKVLKFWHLLEFHSP